LGLKIHHVIRVNNVRADVLPKVGSDWACGRTARINPVQVH
jgi:hypothetical protein